MSRLDTSIKDKSEALNQTVARARSTNAQSSWIRTRLSGPGAIYNLGNVLALGAGIALSLREAWGQSSFSQALHSHLMGSPEASWLTLSMILFIIAGEFYHRAYLHGTSPPLVAWGDFMAGLAAIALTIALVKLGDTAMALLAGLMLSLGKLGSAALAVLWSKAPEGLDRVLRLTVVASRGPSILALALAVMPAIQGAVPFDTVLLPLIMIVCFLLWLWADLLLITR